MDSKKLLDQHVVEFMYRLIWKIGLIKKIVKRGWKKYNNFLIFQKVQ